MFIKHLANPLLLWNISNGQQRGEEHAAHEGHAHDVAGRGVDAAGEDEGHDAQDEGEGGHNDRSHAQFRGSDGGVHQRDALLAEQPVGVFDDQNGVLGRQPDQHDERDLHVDVVDVQAVHQVRASDEQHRAQHRHRHAHQDRQRQPPRFVEGRQREEHEHEGQRVDQPAGLRGVGLLIGGSAPRRADVVGQRFGGRGGDLPHDGRRRGCFPTE